MLPLVVLLAALVAVPLVALAGAWRGHRAADLGLVAALTLLGTLAVLWVTAGESQVASRVPGVLGQGLDFALHRPGLMFALVSTGLWAAATAFAAGYVSRARTRYFVFSTLCLAGNLGFYLAGDFFTLFVFFELVSLASYALVVHEQDEEALAAGRLYLYLGILGGLSILGGLLVLGSITGGTAFAPEVKLAGRAGGLAVALLVLGFAVKAGLVPLHFWLPRAHPAAPTPASALLSGVVIKTGIYGIARTLGLLAADQAAVAGQLVLWVAAATMLLGGTLALCEVNVKRLLAYSSVSQIGFITCGLACALLLADDGAIGMAGALFHVFNHAFFKGTLFMLVGMVYLRAHRLELTSLRGAGRGLPLVGAAFLVAAAGMAGVPGSGGYASKTLLHEALVEAAHIGVPGLGLAEVLFKAAAALTVAYAARLCYVLFISRPEERRPGGERPVEQGLTLGLGGLMLAVGLRPGLWLERLVLPAVTGLGYGGKAIEHLGHVEFFGLAAIKGALWPLALGLALFGYLLRRDFRVALPLPGWSMARVVTAVTRGGEAACRLAERLDAMLDPSWVARWGGALCHLVGRLDTIFDPARALRYGEDACRIAREFDAAMDPERALFRPEVEGAPSGVDAAAGWPARWFDRLAHALRAFGGWVKSAVSDALGQVVRADPTLGEKSEAPPGRMSLMNLNVAGMMIVSVVVVALLLLVVLSGR